MANHMESLKASLNVNWHGLQHIPTVSFVSICSAYFCCGIEFKSWHYKMQRHADTLLNVVWYFWRLHTWFFGYIIIVINFICTKTK